MLTSFDVNLVLLSLEVLALLDFSFGVSQASPVFPLSMMILVIVIQFHAWKAPDLLVLSYMRHGE